MSAAGLARLEELESLRTEFGPEAAARKARCLAALKSAQLTSAEQVHRLHEALCYLQAWPDDERVLERADAMLAGFSRRRDLQRHVDALAGTGIAGTAMRYRFFAVMARWLAQRWPEKLHVDWDEFENAEALLRFVTLLGSFGEVPALETEDRDLRAWIERLKRRKETDAAFLLGRLAARLPDELTFDALYEELDVPLILAPGRDVPSRSRTRHGAPEIRYQTGPIDRAKPTVDGEAARLPKAPRRVGRAEGERLVELARAAMFTRARDLEAFACADPRDVSVVECDDLQVVICGVRPERRFVLESLHGLLILKNGVPVSYGPATCLFGSVEWAYSQFETFRGSESARILVRGLAVARRYFGCDTVMVDTYQIGADNEDAIASGAWWFYQKLGFRPRGEERLRIMRRELAAMERDPRHRSSKATLRELATEEVYLELDRSREDVLGRLDLAGVAARITELLAKRFGGEREQGERVLADEAAQALGVTSFRGWTSGERLAWRRWAPLVALLGAARWPARDRRRLAVLIRAKGGRQELDYLRAFDAFPRLRRGIARLARSRA